MFVDFHILNELGSPSINSNTFANRPPAGQIGRLFVSTDTYEIYRDNGSTWDLIGGPGSSTVTGTGAATQVAYWTASQAIGGSNNLWWDNTNKHLGIGINTPSGLIHADGGASAARMILDADTGVARIFSFRTDNLPRWALRVDGAETGSNAGADLAVRAYNDAGAFTFAPLTIARSTGKSNWQATETYSTGVARGNYFDYNLSVAAGGSFSSPNSISAVGASLDLTLAGNATIPSGARSGLDAYNTVSFTGTGTLTHSQGTQIRAYSNVTAGWAFNGTAIGTITHLASLRALFPDNTGSAVDVTNNYALLLNDQTANTGMVNYTNRWGVYQEGTSDLNYFAANTLIGTTVNAGYKLDVSGSGRFANSALFNTTGGSTLLGTTNDFTTITQGGPLEVSGIGIYPFTRNTGATNTTAKTALTVANNTTITATGTSNDNIFAFFSAPKLTHTGAGSSTFELTAMQLEPVILSSGTNSRINLLGAYIIASRNNANDISTNTNNRIEGIRITAEHSSLIPTTAQSARILGNYVQTNNNNGITSLIASYRSDINVGIAGTSSSATTMAQFYSSLFQIGTVATSTVTNGYGIFLVGPTIGATGTLTNYYAFYQGAASVTGTLTNHWGIYIDDTNANNYFKGNVLIGSNVNSGQKLQVTGTVKTSDSITTGTPNGGTAGAWKFGIRVAATVALDTTQYIQLDIGGTLYKLAIVT